MPPRKGVEAAKASSKSFSSGRLQELFFKDGDEHFVRFLTGLDDWLTVDSHIAVPTKPKPESWRAEAKWPTRMSAVCANDEYAFQGTSPDDPTKPDGVWVEGFGNCYIHANYAEVLDNYKHPYSNSRALTYALVILRERNGKQMRDVEEEWSDAKGNKHNIPAVRVIAQPWKSVFSAVHAAAVEDDMVTTKDFFIKKDGKEFNISGLSITTGHHPKVTGNPILGDAPETPSWKRYADVLAMTEIDLWAYIQNKASDDWMKLWFWPGEWDAKKDDDTEAEGAGSDVGGGGASDLSPEDEAKFAAYKARLEKQQAAATSS